MSKISVIVPVYQVENVLDECIKTIVNQTFKDIEILLINDGSLDRSKQICEYWEKKDSRIRLYNKENGGLSDARNYGIEKSTSDFLFFLDSDDKIEKKCLEILYKSCSEYNCDISAIKITRNENKVLEEKKEKKDDFNFLSKDDSMNTILSDNEWGTSACGKLFKKELFKNISFPVGKLYEDLATVYLLYNEGLKFCFINRYGYYYRITFDSITTQSFNRKQLDLLYYSNEVENFVENNYSNEVLITARNRKIRCILKMINMMIGSKENINNNELNEYQEYIRKYLGFFLKSEYSLKHKIASILISFIPRTTIKVLIKNK
ncbi:glycosyltransferase family 2 protein [Vagococcus fluvialis]|uniref:glycosyltransferase family 2 protein n=1 Tax=Vagococcus fluvialis TaxID=2738 RepID=UPI003B21A8FB